MRTACLLLHGFAGTPFEIAPLAPGLEKLGCTVDIPTLPGHGTSIADFRTTFFRDWYACAEQHFLALYKTHDKVFIGGFSMGGSMALLLAAQYPCAGVFTLAAPLFPHRIIPWQVRDWRLLFTGILQHIAPELPIRKAKRESRAIAPFEGYEGILCIPQLHSVRQALPALHHAIRRITCPALLIHDMHDKLALPESALAIAKCLLSKDVTLHYTHMTEHITSHHMLATHQETKEEVAGLVTAFVKRLMGQERE